MPFSFDRQPDENELECARCGAYFHFIVTDDHPVVRSGLRALLTSQPDFNIVAEAENGEEVTTLSVLIPRMSF